MIGRTNVGGGSSAPSYSIQGWCATIGLSYSVLADIPESDMRQLMTKYASVAYFMEWYSNEPSMIDDFIANAYATKWIGLRDYICDQLMALQSVRTKMLASANWEYILKDHVPTMTSDTAPYGEAIATSNYSGRSPYMAFNASASSWLSANGSPTNQRIAYKFTSPICVQKFHIDFSGEQYLENFKLQGSNDGTTWVDITPTIQRTGMSYSGDVNNSNYYMYYGLLCNTTKASYVALSYIQFYGRSLNVSVPKMTSNTAPYGEASASSEYRAEVAAWVAMGYPSTGGWDSAPSNTQSVSEWLQYTFTNPIVVKFVHFSSTSSSSYFRSYIVTLQGSNDNFTSDIHDLATITIASVSEYVQRVAVNNNVAYSSYRLKLNHHNIYQGGHYYSELQNVCLYGVDYSERTDRTYLYDHGLYMNGVTSFQNVTITQTSPYAYSGVAEIHNNPQSVSLSYSTSNANFVVASTKLNNKVQFGNDNWLFVASENTSLGRPEYHIGNTPEIEGSKVSAKTVNNLVEGLDISQISGQYYIDFRIYGRNDLGRINIDITEIWLE